MIEHVAGLEIARAVVRTERVQPPDAPKNRRCQNDPRGLLEEYRRLI